MGKEYINSDENFDYFFVSERGISDECERCCFYSVSKVGGCDKEKRNAITNYEGICIDYQMKTFKKTGYYVQQISGVKKDIFELSIKCNAEKMILLINQLYKDGLIDFNTYKKELRKIIK